MDGSAQPILYRPIGLIAYYRPTNCERAQGRIQDFGKGGGVRVTVKY